MANCGTETDAIIYALILIVTRLVINMYTKAHGSQLARGIIKQSTPSKGAQVFDTFILAGTLKNTFFF